jgi:hypothetical protein
MHHRARQYLLCNYCCSIDNCDTLHWRLIGGSEVTSTSKILTLHKFSILKYLPFNQDKCFAKFLFGMLAFIGRLFVCVRSTGNLNFYFAYFKHKLLLIS